MATATSLLVLICVMRYISAASIPSNNLTFVGSIARQLRKETFYFVTQNAAAFKTTEHDCKSISDTTSLVDISSRRELEKLAEFIHDNDDTGASYYTGATYNADSKSFIWDKSQTDIDESWFPWSEGHPKTNNTITKIIAVRVPGKKLQFKTVFQTESFRGICELEE